jgi:hypothetical protein
MAFVTQGRINLKKGWRYSRLGHMDLQTDQRGQRLEMNILKVDNEHARRAVIEHMSQLRERLAVLAYDQTKTFRYATIRWQRFGTSKF